MAPATVSRWARRYVLVSALSLLSWQLAALVGVPRLTEMFLALFGFVLHMVFGKAYSLVPSYFARTVAFPRAPAVQFPLVVLGTGSLVGASLQFGPSWLEPVGALLWSLGVIVFLGTLFWTLRTNLTGRETATGETNVDRRPVDRTANGFVPVALLYLAVGSYETLAIATSLPPLLDGYFPRVTHLIAAGTAGLLIFALGFRLLPRFLVAHPPRRLVVLVLATGAVGPSLLAVHLWNAPWFYLGALLETVAVVGFALGYGLLFVRSDRRRVGFYGVLAGALCGVVAAALGVGFAIGHSASSAVLAHLRLNLLGFLGLSIVGIAYQFYPPAIGTLPGASNRTAFVSIGALAGGLFGQTVGLVGGVPAATTLGELSTLVGAALYLFLLAAVFQTR
ncbi:hypothetical protein SAMN04487948_11239 [Halogranum amylolyticum]|uniref:Uncharacterized protein n=1 Tax=Halogranum amylolyticum TaxID=660520 RepID=A0A1H8UQP6_9EURY|nr:hypothetical protein [Halogranum amylolyticum]SEP05471.1 hypothetical protein SAMN04487948_11239 [Halogranum amylolyticum]